MRHCFLCRKTLLVIISQQLVQEINRFISDKSLIIICDKLIPRFTKMSAQDAIILGRKFDGILFNIFKEFISTKNTSNLDQLIIIIVTMEKWFLAEDLILCVVMRFTFSQSFSQHRCYNSSTYHTSKHAAITPHIQTIIIFLEIDQ